MKNKWLTITLLVFIEATLLIAFGCSALENVNVNQIQNHSQNANAVSVAKTAVPLRTPPPEPCRTAGETATQTVQLINAELLHNLTYENTWDDLKAQKDRNVFGI